MVILPRAMLIKSRYPLHLIMRRAATAASDNYTMAYAYCEFQILRHKKPANVLKSEIE